MKQLLVVLLSMACVACTLAGIDPAQLSAARALYNERGKSLEAQQAFEKIAADDASCAEAQYYLAHLALRRDDPDAAIAAAEKAVAFAPENADYQHTLGDAFGGAAQKASIFRQPGLAKKCLAAFQRAAVLAPANVDFHQSLLDYYRQAPGLLGGGTDKALAEAATIKQLDPQRGRIAFATLYVAEKKYDQALAEFDEVLKTSPDDYSALYQVGKLAAVSGQFLDRGFTSLRRCLALPPPDSATLPGAPAVHYRLGMILEKKNAAAAARAEYEAALKLDPKFTPATDALKKLK